MSLTPEQSHFLGNLRLQLIGLSKRLEQDVDEDVAYYVLFWLQQALNHLPLPPANTVWDLGHTKHRNETVSGTKPLETPEPQKMF